MAVAGAGGKIPDQLMKDKQATAAKARVEFKVNDAKLRGQFNLATKRCLHNDWDSLARALNLHHNDIPQLQARVKALGLSEPTRPKLKNTK